MSWRSAWMKFHKDIGKPDEQAAVRWLEASIELSTGPAFMPDDYVHCKALLQLIKRLQTEAGSEQS